jgi:hypothetical protein
MIRTAGRGRRRGSVAAAAEEAVEGVVGPDAVAADAGGGALDWSRVAGAEAGTGFVAAMRRSRSLAAALRREVCAHNIHTHENNGNTAFQNGMSCLGEQRKHPTCLCILLK